MTGFLVGTVLLVAGFGLLCWLWVLADRPVHQQARRERRLNRTQQRDVMEAAYRSVWGPGMRHLAREQREYEFARQVTEQHRRRVALEGALDDLLDSALGVLARCERHPADSATYLECCDQVDGVLPIASELRVALYGRSKPRRMVRLD